MWLNLTPGVGIDQRVLGEHTLMIDSGRTGNAIVNALRKIVPWRPVQTKSLA